jgi:hypothetical protein
MAVFGLISVDVFAVVVLFGSVFFIAMVAICGVIYGDLATICYITLTACWAGVGILLATYRARISSSVSTSSKSSSSESDGAVRSATIDVGGGGFAPEPCNFINNFAHFVVPSTSSILFSLLLVVVM